MPLLYNKVSLFRLLTVLLLIKKHQTKDILHVVKNNGIHVDLKQKCKSQEEKWQAGTVRDGHNRLIWVLQDPVRVFNRSPGHLLRRAYLTFVLDHWSWDLNEMEGESRWRRGRVQVRSGQVRSGLNKLNYRITFLHYLVLLSKLQGTIHQKQLELKCLDQGHN